MVQYMNNQPNGFQQFSQMKNSGGEKKGGLGFFGWALVVLAVYWLFLPKSQVPVSTTDQAQVQKIDISKVPTKTIASDKISATIQGLRIYGINLNGYLAKQGDNADMKLLGDKDEFVEVGLLASGTETPLANTVWTSNGNVYEWKSKNGVTFRRKIEFSDNKGYVANVIDTIENNSGKNIMVSQYSRIVRHNGSPSKFAVKVGSVTNIAGKVSSETWDKVAKKSPIYQVAQSEDQFAGFTDQYWQVVTSSSQASDKTIKLKKRADGMFQSEISPEYIQIEAGKSSEITTKVFAGPKTQGALLEAGRQISGLDKTLDYGWFAILSRPFLWTLNRLHDLIPNYGIAIILLTLIIRALMWPLSKKSHLSMLAMQKLSPEMKRIQSLYGDDKIRMQQEIMRLYQTHKTNPLSSIGMMFLQIPIFFALYKALLIAVPLRHAGFLWLKDLSVMDPYFILPILMAATMWFQNRLSQSENSNTPGANMMKYLPIIFAVMFAWMPSGLVLYWTVSNIVGIIQLRILKR